MTTKVTKQVLGENSVGTAQIEDGAVTGTKYANNSIPTAAYANDSVTQAKMAPASVGTPELIDGSVTGPKYAANSIPATAIADASIPGSKLTDGSVSGAKISDGSITSAKYGFQSIDGSKIIPAEITSSLLADESVVTQKVLDAAITFPKLQDAPAGSLVFYNSSNKAAALNPGANGKVLTISNGTPVWGDVGLPTGLVMDYYGGSAPSGWVICDGGTIGNTGSGANYADVSARALFIHIWNSVPNSIAEVSTGRGSTASADWDANKTIKLPDLRGRTTVGVETQQTTPADRITTTTFASGVLQVGNTGGAETVTLQLSQLPEHRHHTTVNSDLVGTTPTEAPLAISTFYRGYETFYSLAYRDVYIAPSTGMTSSQIDTTGNAPGSYSQGHPNVQPSMLMLKIMKL